MYKDWKRQSYPVTSHELGEEVEIARRGRYVGVLFRESRVFIVSNIENKEVLCLHPFANQEAKLEFVTRNKRILTFHFLVGQVGVAMCPIS